MCVLLRYLLLGTMIAIASVRVHAQPAPAVDKNKVARQYVDAGLAAKDSGDYDTAIDLYAKAYELVPNPLLVFNMAEANRLAGRVDEALKQYTDYLSRDPKGIRAQAARDEIERIEAAKEEARKVEETRKAEEARRLEQARKLEAARAAEQTRQAREHPAIRTSEPTSTDESPRGNAVPTDEPQPHGRSLRLSGIGIGSAGVVTLGIGIGFGLHAQSLADQASRSVDPAKVRAGERANTIAITGMIAGPLLIAGGAALWWWGYTQGNHERIVLAPMVSDQLTGLSIAGPLP